MAFRIGLLFKSLPSQAFARDAVTSLLQEIDERTRAVRGGVPLTLVPFVRTIEAAGFSRDVAGVTYSVEAATWDKSGVVFRSLQVLTSLQHSPPEPKLDFDRGMGAVLSLSHVVVIVCASSAEFDDVTSLAKSFENVWALLALVSLQDNKRRFLKIDPTVAVVEPVDWFVKVKKRWQEVEPTVATLPAAKTAILGLLFPWLTSAIIRRRFENVKRRSRSAVERCREGMGLSESAMEKLYLEDQRLLNQNMGLLCPLFTRHDDLGRYYSNVFRTTCLLVPLLIAASAVLAVAAVINVELRDLWHLLEGILLMAAAWLFLRSRSSGHHAKWVEHRLTTELMRSSIICNLLHAVPRLDLPAEEPERWVRQAEVFWTYLRALPALSFSTPGPDLLSARRSAVADYASYQQRFHTDFASQHYKAQKWLVKVSGWAFLTTLCLVTLQLVIAYLPPPSEGMAVKFTIATLVCACGAFVFSLLAYQLGFEAIAERSNNAALHFGDLRMAMDQGASTAYAERVYGWANECAYAVLNEQHSWYRHIPLIRMHL